jgi:hypothetical protein
VSLSVEHADVIAEIGFELPCSDRLRSKVSRSDRPPRTKASGGRGITFLWVVAV